MAGGALELGALTAFLLYLRRFYDPLDELAQFFNAYQSAAAALEKIAAVLDTPADVPEPAAPVALPSPVRGELRFAGVRFAYRSDRRRTVLPELSLTVPAGQTVALVGATGAGKSTLAKLAARFYDPTDGAVTAGRRRPARCRRRRAAHRARDDHAGGVPVLRVGGRQHRAGAAGRVAGGGRRGRGGRGARAFVEALPDGFDTDVRKRGGRLSAGQRQLVGLARVVLADPAVVLLDEATSSLDVPSERAVQAALETVLADRTALIIAHRLSTVLIADRVLVMADGRVVEDGSPARAPRRRWRVRRAPRRLARQPGLEHLTPLRASLGFRDGESGFSRRRVSRRGTGLPSGPCSPTPRPRRSTS